MKEQKDEETFPIFIFNCSDHRIFSTRKEGVHLLFEDIYLSSDSLKTFPMKVISKKEHYKKGLKHGKNITYKLGEHKWVEVKDENGNVIRWEDDQYKIIEKYNYGEWVSKKRKICQKRY